jgi:hypothetical protein
MYEPEPVFMPDNTPPPPAKKRKGGLKKQMNDLIANRPQYQINPEAYDNKAIATARAFGKDRGIAMAEENVDRDMAANVGQVKNITGNTNAILDTLRSLNESGTAAKRGLAQDEARMQGQRVNELYNVNEAMVDEKDKAWNFNVNEPYQNKIQALRDKKKFRQEAALKAMDMVGTIAGSALSPV